MLIPFQHYLIKAVNYVSGYNTPAPEQTLPTELLFVLAKELSYKELKSFCATNHELNENKSLKQILLTQKVYPLLASLNIPEAYFDSVMLELQNFMEQLDDEFQGKNLEWMRQRAPELLIDLQPVQAEEQDILGNIDFCVKSIKCCMVEQTHLRAEWAETSCLQLNTWHFFGANMATYELEIFKKNQRAFEDEAASAYKTNGKAGVWTLFMETHQPGIIAAHLSSCPTTMLEYMVQKYEGINETAMLRHCPESIMI